MSEFWEKLINEFIKINSQINLSAIRDPEWIYTKHILDSIENNKILKFRKWQKVCDVWTWWWFPLIPLAMTNPEINFVWIDSVRKKINAIQTLIKNLNIQNIDLVCSRAEDYKNEKFDYVLARAVAYIDKLIDWTYDLCKPWWYLIFYKQIIEQEKKDLIKICKRKKLTIVKQHNYNFWDSDIQRVIYVIKKR